jgi:hypothetical protein
MLSLAPRVPVMTSVVAVDDARTRFAFVSLFAQQIGGFVHDFPNVTVQEAGGPAPTVILPPISVPMSDPPVPHVPEKVGAAIAVYSICPELSNVIATDCAVVEMDDTANPILCPAFDIRIRSLALDVAAQSFAA